MDVEVWRSAKKSTKFLAVPAGTDVTKIPFPSTLDPDLQVLQAIPRKQTWNKGDVLIAVDVDRALREIDQHGYTTIEATITVKIG